MSQSARSARSARSAESAGFAGSAGSVSDVRPLSSDEVLGCLAILAASKAGNRGEVPVGAVLCDPSGRVLSESGNQVHWANNPLGHAEMLALVRGAVRLGNCRLSGCRLVVSLQPCPMCMGAIEASRLFHWSFLAERLTGDMQGSCCETVDYGTRKLNGDGGSMVPFSSWSVALLQFFFESRR